MGKYGVVSGICNLDTDHPELLAADATILPNPIRGRRIYKFVHHDNPIAKGGISKVFWAGFPFMAIERSIVEKIEFEDDSSFNGNDKKGWAVDVMFCYRCNKLGIGVYVDFGIVMKHLKGDYDNVIKTGMEQPKVLFNGNDISQYCHSKYLTEEDIKPMPLLNFTINRESMV
jgi:hypothetical protein